MKCAICIGGKTAKGFRTVLLEKDETTLIFKQVPSEICENCGEEYISSEVNRSLLRHAREELNRNVSLEMLTFSSRESMKSV
ncbi:MAG: type II toxin-antitoxin system MqsA family antitoxin [Candidatus Electrothrix sp. AU1_5]|nr:type II toxin-antitoxin system MqsA family antitoxin [Candidatus Electrothrix sp. AX1]MCI5181733.1 type II toxin-antitoxin system MqsA family antitoxin [Candidatus Electrothrix gigas]MCI5192753.1 type II toxin-antitoxin system MqsA family antitoxin [Candidatus Electrothrix gigas]